MTEHKTAVCYFSGTGNSLSVARRIASQFDGAGILNIALMPVSAPLASAAPLAGADRIIVVFPVYIWGLPRIIREFFERLATDPGTEIWVAVTNGGLAGDPIAMIREIGKRKGFALASGFLVWTPENFVVRYSPWPAWMNRIALASSRRKTDRIAARIHAGNKGTFEHSFFVINGVLSQLHFTLMRKIYVEHALAPGELFWVTDACVSCGACARVCPKRNISFIGGKPVWGNDCEICVACLQWCPKAAIQAGTKTEGRTRYHHPEVSLADMIVR